MYIYIRIYIYIYNNIIALYIYTTALFLPSRIYGHIYGSIKLLTIDNI